MVQKEAKVRATEEHLSIMNNKNGVSNSALDDYFRPILPREERLGQKRSMPNYDKIEY